MYTRAPAIMSISNKINENLKSLEMCRMSTLVASLEMQMNVFFFSRILELRC